MTDESSNEPDIDNKDELSNEENEPVQLTKAEDNEEDLPVVGQITFASVFENIIKHPGRIIHELRSGRSANVTVSLIVILLVTLSVYGLIVGSFSGSDQIWKAALKITFGAIASGCICIPSLYIFLCLAQVDCRLQEAFGFLLGVLTLTAILLIGFAPVAWVFTASTESIYFIGVLHLMCWACGTYFGIGFLTKAFKSISHKNKKYIHVWSWVFVLVTLQMTCALRPLLGTSDTFLPTEKRFFIMHWLSSDHLGN